jgi:hypothetical protein
MFAVGHLGLGYLLGSASSKLLSVKPNVSYLFLFSVLPDIDLMMWRFGLEHRGPTHSLVLFCAVFLPIFLVFRARAFPYFVALIQHSLIGDLLTGGGSQLLWPLSVSWYRLGSFSVASAANIAFEWSTFLGSMVFLFMVKDVWLLVKPHTSNLILLLPLVFVSFPLLVSAMSFLRFRRILYYNWVPTELIIPHVAFFLLFTFAILVDFGRGAKVLARRIARGQT